jgi:hypothetical protein
MNEILELTPSGLYGREGDFYIDPWRPVNRAVVTHAHADHARGFIPVLLIPFSIIEWPFSIPKYLGFSFQKKYSNLI